MCQALMSFSGKGWNNWPPSPWPPIQVGHSLSLYPPGKTEGFCCQFHIWLLYPVSFQPYTIPWPLRKHLRESKLTKKDVWKDISEWPSAVIPAFRKSKLSTCFVSYRKHWFTFSRVSEWEIVQALHIPAKRHTNLKQRLRFQLYSLWWNDLLLSYQKYHKMSVY